VFVDDCISCEKTIKSGLQVSFTNPENYLPAIKKLVFEDYLTDGNDDDVDLLLREAVVFWKENRSRF
jgi:hypothetical protein